MISMFSTGDFIRVEITESWYGLGRVGMLMGFALMPSREETGAHHLVGIVSGQEGNIGIVATEHIISDHIYDAEKDYFVDKSAQERLDAATSDLEVE